MAMTKSSIQINGIKLPVYYENGERIKSIPMKNWGNLFSPNLDKGIDVNMLVYPWIELSETVVVAHQMTCDGLETLTAYPVLPKVLRDAATPKIRQEATAIKFAKEELRNILKEENLIFDIYTAKVEMP